MSHTNDNNSPSRAPQINDQTFVHILKSAGLNDTQVQTSLRDIRDVLEKDLFKTLAESLSDNQLSLLNSLKTEQSVKRFLQSQLPDLDDKLNERIAAFKRETANKLTELTQQAAAPSIQPPAPSEPVTQPELASRTRLAGTHPTAAVTPEPKPEHALSAPAPTPDPVPDATPPVPAPSLPPAPVPKPAPAPTQPTTMPEPESQPTLPPVQPPAATSPSPTTNPADKTAVSQPEKPGAESSGGLTDLKNKWQKLLDPPEPGSKTKKKDSAAPKPGGKGKLPPLPPLPPMPGAGGGKSEPSPEEKAKAEEERRLEREEALRKIEEQNRKDAELILELRRAIQQKPDPSVDEDATGDQTIDPSQINQRQLKALEKQLKRATSRENWEQAHQVAQMIRQLTKSAH